MASTEFRGKCKFVYAMKISAYSTICLKMYSHDALPAGIPVLLIITIYIIILL